MYEGRYVVLHIDSNDMKFSCDFGSIELSVGNDRDTDVSRSVWCKTMHQVLPQERLSTLQTTNTTITSVHSILCIRSIFCTFLILRCVCLLEFIVTSAGVLCMILNLLFEVCDSYIGFVISNYHAVEFL